MAQQPLDRIPELIVDEARRYATAGVREYMHHFVRASTGRHGQAPGAAVDTTELSSSLELTLGSPAPDTSSTAPFRRRLGAAEVDALMATFNLGNTVWGKWLAGHAAVIDEGRKRRKDGVVRGSIQNPEGFSEPAQKEAERRVDRWDFSG